MNTTLQLSTSRTFLLYERSRDEMRRELATLEEPGKIINGCYVTVIVHVGEVMPYKDGYAAIICVEGVASEVQA